jgi:hypothetical protein
VNAYIRNAAKNTHHWSLPALMTLGICSISTAQAELQILDDLTMAGVTGKAGLTIEIDLKLEVGEIAYQDSGYLAIEDFIWAGANRTGTTGVAGSFDNWKMVIDVTDGSEALAYGFSSLDQYYSEVSAPDADWSHAIASNDDAKVHGDGALVFHNTSATLFDGTRYDLATDSDVAISGAGPTSSPRNSFKDTMDDWRNSAPFGISIGKVKLHSSGYEVGSKTDDGTVLMSDFNAEVLTGPLDIVIENNGSGSTNGIPDSKITISDYFEISDLSVDFDFLGVSVSGVRLHNRRGDSTGLNKNSGADGIADTADDIATESFGFAHAKWYIGAAPEASQGLQIAGAIKGDLDIDRIVLGKNGASIGAIYVTDMTVQASMNIRGHN